MFSFDKGKLPNFVGYQRCKATKPAKPEHKNHRRTRMQPDLDTFPQQELPARATQLDAQAAVSRAWSPTSIQAEELDALLARFLAPRLL